MQSTVVTVVALLLTAAPALADSEPGDALVVRMVGEADVGDADAKTRALDDAFFKAVKRTVSQLATAAQQQDHLREIHDQVLRRARKYVLSYKLLDSETAGGAVKANVDVRVDRGAIRAKLLELGVFEQSETASATTALRPRLYLVYAAAFEGDVSASILSAILKRELSELGFEAGDPVLVTTPPPNGQLAEAALAAGAGGVVVVDVAARGDGMIRGTVLTAGVAKASMIVADVSRGWHVIAEASGADAGFGDRLASGLANAAGGAVREAFEGVSEQLERYWPPNSSRGSALTISLAGARSNGSLRAIEAMLSDKRLGATIVGREFRRGRVQLLVRTTRKATGMAAAIRGLRDPGSSLRVRATDDGVVEVQVGDTAHVLGEVPQ